jgi:Raf kinase inhibitor-like YbhB/YbcL family protein
MRNLRNLGFIILILNLSVLFTECKNSNNGEYQVDKTTVETEKTDPEEEEEEEGTKSIKFSLTSSSFSDGGVIPKVHACKNKGGSDQSPALSWSNPPKNTASYALIVDDESSPGCGTGVNACRHWAVYNIPLTTTSFAVDENITAINNKVTEGTNWKGKIDYAGPCPPSKHTYKFTIYALKGGASPIFSGASHTRSSFQKTFTNFILGSATLKGVFTP